MMIAVFKKARADFLLMAKNRGVCATDAWRRTAETRRFAIVFATMQGIEGIANSSHKRPLMQGRFDQFCPENRGPSKAYMGCLKRAASRRHWLALTTL